MQFKLTNINKIKEATINLNGLTVIAGINDSGKSTVGKVLFSLIKAIGNYIHLLDILVSAQTLKDTKYRSDFMFRLLVNYHIKDMAQKLDAIKYFQPSLFFNPKINSTAIGQITGGKI